MNPNELFPPDLHSAALMIENYGVEHAISPTQLLDLFRNGIQIQSQFKTDALIEALLADARTTALADHPLLIC